MMEDEEEGTMEEEEGMMAMTAEEAEVITVEVAMMTGEAMVVAIREATMSRAVRVTMVYRVVVAPRVLCTVTWVSLSPTTSLDRGIRVTKDISPRVIREITDKDSSVMKDREEDRGEEVIGIRSSGVASREEVTAENRGIRITETPTIEATSPTSPRGDVEMMSTRAPSIMESSMREETITEYRLSKSGEGMQGIRGTIIRTLGAGDVALTTRPPKLLIARA